MTDTKKTIKQRQADATLNIQLNETELTRMKNESIRAGFGDDWRAYATKKFREDVTNSLIGAPTIGVGQKGLVTGPSKSYGAGYVQ